MSFQSMKIPSPGASIANAHGGQTTNNILDKLSRMLPYTSIVTFSSPNYYADKYDGTVINSGSTNAKTVLQDAFNLGGTVFIRNATYPITSALSVPSNTTLMFESWGALIQGAGSHVLLANSDPSGGNSNIKVLGGAFDGNNGTASDGNLTFDKVTNCEVSGCKSINSPSEGIKFRNGFYTIATNNYVNKTALSGGIGKAGIIAATGAQYTNIANNVVVDAGGEAIGCYQGSGKTDIIGNVCRSVTTLYRGHILAEGTTAGSQEAHEVNIVGNNILSDYYGIHILTCIGFNVQGNHIKHFSTTDALDGIRIAGASKYGTVNGNTIVNPAQHGIILMDTARQLTVNGNTIISPGLKTTNTYHGILVTPAGGFIREPTITNNIIVDDQGSPTMSVGISLQAGAQQITNLLCTGNTIRGVNSATIAHSGTVTGFIRNNNGFVTENSGSATVGAASTTQAVSHGLSYTPSLNDVVLMPQGTWGSTTKWWPSNPTSTQFTINVDVAPGGSGLAFGWSVKRTAI